MASIFKRFRDRSTSKKSKSQSSTDTTSPRSDSPAARTPLPSEKLKILDDGLTIVYEHDDAQVDIVLIHGLNGNARKTWTSQTTPPVFWPSDLLPQSLDKRNLRVRIMTFGYNSSVAAVGGGTSNQFLHDHADSLVGKLAEKRDTDLSERRPIIFVCHSLGGLVCKRALVSSRGIQHKNLLHLRSIYMSTFGIVFLGTPHTGSDVTKMGLLIKDICKVAIPSLVADFDENLVKSLLPNNETLALLNQEFVEFHSAYRLFFFYETQASLLGTTRKTIVDIHSAAPVLDGTERRPINADHSHMCKFADEYTPGYEDVSSVLARYAKEAPKEVAKKWEAEDRFVAFREGRDPDRTIASPPTQASFENSPVTPAGAQSSLTSSTILRKQEPLYFVPDSLRTGIIFYGMGRELASLSKILLQQKESDETSAVLVHGIPGSGKTHLVRHFVSINRTQQFKGGIFWVDAKSSASRNACYSNFVEELLKGHAMASASGTPELRGAELAAELKFSQSSGSKWDEIGAMRRWFDTHDDWLIVFDGISLDRETDLESFSKLLPASRMATSVVYTSTDRSLGTKAELSRPSIIDIRQLDTDSAKKLVFRTLGIETPTSAEQAKATEIVRSYRGLPLAIDIVSRHIIATGQQLTKYQPDPYTTESGLANTYRRIVSDLELNEHNGAKALIQLLSFFGHNIPVGMIYLGRGAYLSDDELMSSDRGLRPDLDSLIAVLLRYGLVQRTTTAVGTRSSGSQQNSQVRPSQSIQNMDATPELFESHTTEESNSSGNSTILVDVVSIHSVVQSFFLNEFDKEVFDEELVAAIKVFCISYKTANNRIEELGGSEFVKDYREYEIHGSHLMTHFQRPHLHRKSLLTDKIKRAKHILRNTMAAIREKTRSSDPNASQSSFHGRVSIFDRVSSLSEGPPTPTTVDESSPDKPSRHSTWGSDIERLHSRMSTDDGAIAYVPSTSGRRRFFFFSPPQEIGYETDREDSGDHYTGSKRLSYMTLSTSSEDSETIEDEHSGQDGHSPNLIKRRSTLDIFHRPRRATGGGKDLGDFRPIRIRVPTKAGTVVRQESTMGTFTPRKDATAALSALKIPKMGGAHPQEQPRQTSNEEIPTNENMVAFALARLQQPGAGNNEQNDAHMNKHEIGLGLQSTISHASEQSSLPQSANPLALNSASSGAPTAMSYLLASPTSPHHERSGSDSIVYTRPSDYVFQGPNQTHPGRYSSPFLSGSNAEPLPYEGNVAVSRAPLPFKPYDTFDPTRMGGVDENHAHPYLPANGTRVIRPSSPSMIATFPAGYASVPMSRDTSARSAQSVRSQKSELRQYMKTSPSMQPTDFANLDGNSAAPYLPSPSSSPRFLPAAVTAIASGQFEPLTGTAVDSNRTSLSGPQPMQTQSSGSPKSTASLPMSRSSSGPGILVQSPDLGAPPTIVQFASGYSQLARLYPSEENILESGMSASLLSADPEARRLAFEQGKFRRDKKQRQKAQQKQRYRLAESEYVGVNQYWQGSTLLNPQGLPYPDLNPFPTATNEPQIAPSSGAHQTVKKRASEDPILAEAGNSKRRERGFSSPERPGNIAGLGVALEPGQDNINGQSEEDSDE